MPLKLARSGRLHPELLRKRLPECLVARERLGVPSRSVKREHVLGAKTLAQRVLRDQRLERADDFALLPERELGLDPQLDCGQAKLLETPGLVPAKGFSELGEGGPRQSASAPPAAPSPSGGCPARAPAGRRRPSARNGRDRARRRPFRAGSQGRVCSRGSGSTFRSCDTWICTIFCAESGTFSPQSVDELLAETVRFAFRSRIARSARCLPAAICTGTPSRRTSSGPRRRKSISRWT